MTFKNHMTVMYAMHDALRRDLDRIAGITARPDDDPKHVLRTAVGWEMFKSYLEVHHTAEDDLLWPPMRTALADDPNGTALLDAMEAEHAVIDPMLTAIDTALADRDSGPQRPGHLDCLEQSWGREDPRCLEMLQLGIKEFPRLSACGQETILQMAASWLGATGFPTGRRTPAPPILSTHKPPMNPSSRSGERR